MAKLAIAGGKPVRTEAWPTWPVATEAGIKAVERVLRGDVWSRARGKEVRTFEQRFADYQGAAYGLAVSSGTAALEVGLRSLNLTRGAEVILSPYTFMSSATAILMARCVPIFVDIDPETYNIDPTQIERAITDRTEAIMTVHFGGLPCDMGAIREIARRRNLKIIEDCSHAHGAKWDGTPLGSVGDVGAFSLGAGKNLTAGEGGAVITNDEGTYWNCINYHDHWGGSIKERAGIFRFLPWNYRMSEIQGALLNAQLDVLEQQVKRRSGNGDYLNELLSKLDGVRPLRRDSYVTRNAYHIYTFKYQPAALDGLPRERFIAALSAEGIPASPGYALDCSEQPLFREPDVDLRQVWPRNNGTVDVDYGAMSCPNSWRLCRGETIWLSQNLLMGSRADVEQIVEAVAKIRVNAGELAVGQRA